MPGRDRYRFLGRLPQGEKTPILAAVPDPRTEGTVATLRLYDPIDSWGGPWGTSAKEFVAALDELPASVTEIQLLLNSPGGDVFEGIAILNALRRHRARVVTVVEGLAASAASLIAMAGDEVVMARNSELMIHDAWSICVGNAEDMAQTAENLGRISDNIASVYADKAGGPVEEWRAVMRAEAWYSAAEAVEAGLADRVDDGVAQDDPAPQARFDLSAFNYAGRAEAPPPVIKHSADTVSAAALASALDALNTAALDDVENSGAPEPSPAAAVESVATGDTPQETARTAALQAARFELQSIESATDAA